MSDRDVQTQDPKNDAGREKRDLNEEGRRLVKLVQDEFGELQSKYEEKVSAQLDPLQARLAKLEFLANEEVQTSIRQILDHEDTLQKMFDGEEGKGGALLDRVADLEVLGQRLTKGVDDPVRAYGDDPRAEAFKLFSDRIVSDPILADQLKVDPRLTVDYSRVQAKYLRSGPDVLSAEQRKVLGHGNSFSTALDDKKAADMAGFLQPEVLASLSSEFAPSGGIFITPTMEARILRKIVESSGLLRFAGQKTTTSSRHKFTVETGHLPDTQRRGERETTTTDTEKTFWEEREIHIVDDNVEIELTLAQVEDSGRDIVAELESLAARSFLRHSSQDVVNGKGTTKQVQGLFTASDVPVIKTGTADTAPMFRLTQMSIDILTEYLANARYLFGIGMLMSLILERDGQNRPLWQPSLLDGTPSMFSGFPWAREPYFDRETSVTDSGVTFATGSKVAAFGDIGELYWHVSRRGTRMIRNEITKPGFIKYTWMRRWGAGVALPDAGRILQVGT